MLNTQKLNFVRRTLIAMALVPMMPLMASAQGAYPNKPT